MSKCMSNLNKRLSEKLNSKLFFIMILSMIILLNGCSQELTPKSSGAGFLIISEPTLPLKKASSRAITQTAIGDAIPELTSLKIKLTDESGNLINEMELLNLTDALMLEVTPGKKMYLTGIAYASEETLYSGNLDVEPFSEGESRNIAITLTPTIDLDLNFPTSNEDPSNPSESNQLPVGKSQTLQINNSVDGLIDNTLIWYVNGIEGGDANAGTISTEGIYTPPEQLPENPEIIIKAAPQKAPSFAAEIKIILAKDAPSSNLSSPVFTSSSEFSINENLAAVATILATDDDGDVLVYTIVGGLDDNVFSLDSASGVLNFKSPPNFESPNDNDANNIYLLDISASDGENTTTQNLQITVLNVNESPVANAGIDQSALVGDVITLDASGSFDNDSDPLSFLWSPPDNINLSDNTSANPTFTITNGIKANTQFEFTLAVSDNNGGNNTDSVLVTILNTSPVANAGKNQTVTLGDSVTLNGSNSFDANDDNLSFSWIISNSPNNGIDNFSNPNLETPTIVPSAIGEYTFVLEVSDGIDTNSSFTVVNVDNNNIPQMVSIPGGTFFMGDETSSDGAIQGSGEINEIPIHTVNMVSFEMSQYEITFDEYDQYLQSKGINTNAITSPTNEAFDNGFGRGDHPVINVSWNDIQRYLAWLNEKSGIALDDPNRYRLPSEAEWEYAARAGTTSTFNTGDCIDTSQANFDGSEFNYSKADGTTASCPASTNNFNQTQPVGSYAANSFGLFDVHGNVREWVTDCWHDNYSGASNKDNAWIDNCAQTTGLSRGGAWSSSANNVRSALRHRSDSGYDQRSEKLGFRIARSVNRGIDNSDKFEISSSFGNGDLNNWGVTLTNSKSNPNDGKCGSFQGDPNYFCAIPANDGKSSYFIASPDFHGDNSSFETLNFDIWTQGGTYYVTGSALGDVTIQNGAKSATYFFDVNNQPTGNWKAYSIPLTNDVWSLTNATNMDEILVNVTDILIRAEYGGGTDYTGLDNVYLSKLKKPKMTPIPAGTFFMGDETSADGLIEGAGTANEIPIRPVSIVSFEMSQYEITFDEYDQYLQSKGINTNAITSPTDEAYDNGYGRGNRPVINVSWNDIQNYLVWLNEKSGFNLDDPNRYRLPSEAEWEYATRAETTSSFNTGDCIDTSQANFDGSEYNYSKADGTTVSCPVSTNNFDQPQRVGSYAANPFGLFDVHGNVREWVADCWHENYSGASNKDKAWIDNCAQTTGLSRGGAWSSSANNIRSALRHRSDTGYDDRSEKLGFRIARSVNRGIDNSDKFEILASFDNGTLDNWDVTLTRNKHNPSDGNCGSFQGDPNYFCAVPSNDGKSSYFIASPDFHGDNSSFQTLNFDIWTQGGTHYTTNSGLGDVTIQNGDKFATYFFDVNNQPTNHWKTFSIPLTNNVWSLSNATNINEILVNVTDILIRAEYGGDIDYTGLDNVYISQKIARPIMLTIPGGTFLMGDETSEDGKTPGLGASFEVPVHSVSVAPFEMSQYEVSFEEYDLYLQSKGIDTANISGTVNINNITGPMDEGFDNGWGRGKRPVVGVSWDDIQGYLDWLNSQSDFALDDPKRYRLPSEAEWEYAARAGSSTAYFWGDSIDHDNANYGSDICCGGLAVNNTIDSFTNTAPVGLFAENAFGLFDLHGNAWEWISDCWHEDYTGAPNDSTAWLDENSGNCTERVLRGGSWDNIPEHIRSGARHHISSDSRYVNVGFRLARSL